MVAEERVKAMTISEKIGQALADMEAVRKDLQVIEADQAELKAVRAQLDAAKAELEETRARVEAVKADRAKHDEDFQTWREISAREQARTSTAIDAAQTRLAVLEGQVKERQAEHAAILDGIQALGRRLRIA